MTKCETYKPDKVDGCTHLDIKTYSIGVSRYCKWFDVDIYELEDCPLRPHYSGEPVKGEKE
jgi:hypothetical protein